jgi:predicted transcriptional regulator of viral defense system
MKTIIQKQNPGIIRPSDLNEWIISHGISSVTTDEIAHLLGIPAIEVPQRLVRSRTRGRLVSVARGLWIAVSPEYREMGAPEPIHYIHDLMDFYECEYCVGWLTASSIYGASHQASQVYQVATTKKLRNRIIGRSEIQFFYRSYVQHITKTKISLSNGTAYISTPGATMLMVMSDPVNCAGIDNAATIICELVDNNSDYMKDILKNAPLFPMAAVRRLGWMLDHIVDVSDLNELSDYCSKISEPALLSPGSGRTGSIDKKWNVIENRIIEVDI